MTNNSKKIFLIGANKTGTSSTTQAFENMGIRVCPYQKTYRIWNDIVKNDLKVTNEHLLMLDKLVKEYDFFQDLPICFSDMYKKIYDRYDNCFFILTTRDSEKWVDSVYRWCSTKNCHGVYEKIWNQKDIEQHRRPLIEKFEMRNREIMEYFKDKGVLFYCDIETISYEKIAKALGIEIEINASFPKLNVNKETK